MGTIRARDGGYSPLQDSGYRRDLSEARDTGRTVDQVRSARRTTRPPRPPQRLRRGFIPPSMPLNLASTDKGMFGTDQEMDRIFRKWDNPVKKGTDILKNVGLRR
ncbi:hypothetical protein [Methanosalsum natronophilum]|uniref:hypothetical protein n=1 Tax=Methanosalsum natronophilum TaxID=768733 RepID=UPI002169A922|nr:hypothetical protein [Methanosalsum natronophilum]MCS3924099.1 hypothetical protein [Methanosalsum natronophilum]